MNSGAEEMTTRELLELASLDSLGLLDDVESAIYTRSFLNAPATVQDEVVRLQAEVCGDLVLLPTEEPDSTLRERVMKAVADAVARDEARLAPLARIGRRRGAAGSQARSLLGSGMLWRAACFALTGISLVLAWFLAMGYQGSNDLAKIALSNDAAALEVLLGSTAKTFLLDGSTKVVLNPVDDGTACRASAFVNESAGAVFILFDDLPSTEGDYVVQIVLKEGGTQQLQAFPRQLGFGGLRLDLPAALIAGAARWQIADRAGAILLTSA
jgi:hypothetical protein